METILLTVSECGSTKGRMEPITRYLPGHSSGTLGPQGQELLLILGSVISDRSITS